jgi:vacuolar-type H+-ATPase subunit E/Vma4
MSDLIEIYQENIKTIYTRVGKLLDNINNQSSDKTDNTIIEAENGIKEAERIVKIKNYK